MFTHNREDLILSIERAERSPFAAPLAAMARELALDECDAPADFDSAMITFDPFVA